jgi:hypothetical protein
MSTRNASTSLTGGISRRQLLQVGGLSLFSLGLPQLLGAERRREPGSPGGTVRSCILIVQQGGPSHLDTWDLKPEAPAEIRGPFRPIRTRVPGMQVCEHLPRLARLADRYCLIRSMRQPSADHFAGMHICLSGQSNPPGNAPYVGSIVARLRPATRNIPSYVWLQNMEYDAGPRYQTGGSLGQAFAPLRVGTYLDNPSAPDFRVKAFDPPAGVSTEQLLGRRQLLATLDPSATPLGQTKAGTSVRRLQERALDLVTGPEARRAFDLDREPAAVRERYGRHPLGQNLLMARRLIEAGVRLVSIHAWTGVAPGAKLITVNIWDGHGGIDYIGNTFGAGTYGLRFILPRLDQAVSALLEDLEQRGLLQDTLVAMLGEFGRTPTISKQGRDHWPHCYSAMLTGGGVRGGTVYGASDQHGAYVKDRPVSPEDFGATLLSALGIAPGTRLSPDGFTNPASTGQPVLDLFG